MELHAAKNKIKILIIDDELSIREVLAESLKDDGFEVFTAADGPSGLEMLKTHQPDICFLDIWMPGRDGMDILKQAAPSFQKVVFVMISGHGNIETAIKATRLGAWDFIEKPLSLEKVNLAIDHILKLRAEREEKHVFLNKLRKSIALVGESSSMTALREKLTDYAKLNKPIYIEGERGSGRELAALNLHYLSSRASSPISVINCQGLAQDLIEYEIFGIENLTDFPGVKKPRKGQISLVEHGTLVLKEFSEIPLVVQDRLADLSKNKADVQLIFISSEKLELLAKKNKISAKLYTQLKDHQVKIPSLKERMQDLHSLVDHFSGESAKQFSTPRKTISEKGFQLLLNHAWPGNVRELKNFIERLYILTPSEVVNEHDIKFSGLMELSQTLSQEIDEENLNLNSDQIPHTFRTARAHFEKEFLIKKIKENNGNISKTAEQIGLERSFLHRKIKAYKIEVTSESKNSSLE